MGNEASQEGGEGAPQQAPQQQRPVPPLVTQQSMPLPASQEVVPPPESGGGRRGSAGPQLMMRRASSTGVPPPPVGAAGSKRGSIVEIPTELDLSNLSEEERATILSVMARAQSMEEDLPPPAPKEEEIEKREPEKEIEKCSLCRASPKEGSCVECGALCCRKCSKAIPSGKKHVWMCVRCVDRYPQLQSTINKKEPSVTNDEVPADRRRRASEVTPHPAGSVQQQGLPPARGRSDSLPSQKPRMQQRTLPSQRPDLPQQRYPNDVQGQRPQGPQQNSSPRPQHPQQVRPRHPSDQQKGHRASGPPRPQHPNDQQRFPHPNEQQRFPHPNEQQRFPHPNEQQRFQHPNEQQRFQHPNDQQRFPHPSDQQRFPHPSDQQRFPHTNDQQKFAHPNGQVKAQHPIEHLDKQYPDQLVQKQHKTNDHHRDHYANEPQQSQMHMDQRTQHPTDSKNQNVLDERIQQSPQQSRNISVEQQRIQNSNHRDQITNEKKVSSSENRYQNDHGKSQNLVEPPRSLHDQKHSSDQQRAQHTVDQPRSKPLNGQSQPKYAHEQFGHPIELHQKSLTAEQRTTDQRPQHPFSQQQEIQRMQHSAETNSHLANNMQVSMQKSQQHDEHYNSQHPKYHTEKEADYFQQQMGPQNDPMRPRPQHPLTQPNQNLPPEGTVQSYPQKPPVVQEFLPLRPQAPDVSQMTPPPRNQRLRQPPEQQMVPKPQHPQQSTQELVHYPQVIFENNAKASEKDSHNQDSHKFQTQHELATDKQKDQNQISKHQNIPERAHSKQLNGQQFPPESIKKAGNRYVQDGSGQQHLIEEGNLDEARRQDIMQKQFNQMPESLPHDKTVFAQRQNPPNRQTVPRPTETMQSTTLDNDKNGLYVSLNEQIPCQSAGLLNQDLLRQFPQQHQNVIRSDNTTPSPPATLPRTKPPEIPQPASRTRRDKPESGNQTLPRSGTNPFRTDTNPFRRESLPAEAIDAGEYVTVAPRRGSLDDKMKLMSTHDQNRLNDRIKPSESCSMQKDKGLEDQDPFEKSKNSQETDAFTQSMYNRHLDEERRRNAINSGISVSDSNSRRQLPSIEKQKKQPLVPYVEQGQVPPVPKMRTSLPETSFGESRNGIPRTVPLTSLTLQQQNDQVHGHFKQSDDLNQGEKDKMAINDLSQLREENDSRCALRQDQQKLRDDLVHPNIVVDNSANSSAHQIERNTEGPSKPKPPPTQPRKKSDAQRDQTNSDSYRGKAQGQQGWSEFPHDQRKNKPIHPNDNLQDIAGYQDEEEEEDIDDYFQMIENAITDRKPQVIVGGRKTSDIQRQLFNKEVDKDHAKAGVSEYVLQKGQVTATLRQIDAYNQNQIQQSKPISSSKQQPTVYGQRNTIETVKEKNDLNMYEQDKILSSKKDFYDIDEADYTRDKKDSQYIIQPTDQRSNHSVAQEEYGKAKPEYTKGYDKLLLHELTPDTRQPSAKHYLEEHKTQPVSYEAFSSAKAMQQMQVDPRQQQYAMQQQKFSQQQVKDAENRNQQAYYYSQQYSGSSYQSMGSSDDSYDNENSMKGQPSNSSKPSAIDLQNQKKPKPKPDPQDWSPVSDLSPILDVSPSIEAAEQELMEKFQEKGVEDQEIDLVEEDDSRLLKAGGIPRAKSGTISGMLEEFTRALGLPGTSPLDDSGIKSAVSPTSLAMSPISNVGSSVSTVSTLQKEYQDGFGSPQKTTSGSPQKTPAQPTTPRRSHRRLPQPTVEQMQAAVAMAAQGPRDKPQHPESTTTGDVLFGVEANKGSTNGRPTSPVMTWKSPDMNQSFELAYNKQQGQPSQETQVTVPPSPAPRAQPRSNNNTQKVNEVNQIALTPNSQDASQVRRLRSASYGGNPSAKPSEDIVARLNGGGSSSPHGTNNVFSDIIATTVGSPQTPSTPRDKTGDSSDTQSEAESIKSVRLRRKLPNLPQDQSPSPSPTRKTLEKGKNGIDFQDSLETESSSPVPASAVTVTTTVTTSLETSKQYSPLSALGTPSPQPVGGSLSPLLGRRTELSRTPSPGGEAGTKLPQYMQSLKQQLRDELKAVTEERKVMLEQRGKERGDGERAKTPQPLISVEQPSTESKEDIETLVVSEPHSPYQTQSVSPTRAVPQSQQIMQSQMFPQTPQMTPTSQAQIKPVQQMISQSQYQPQILSPYRTHPTHHQSNQSLYQSPSSNVPQQQVHYQAQTYAQQEQMLYQTLQETGRRTPQPVQARTPLPDAVPQYAGIHRANDDDITIMTTATTTVVSASEQWHDGKRQRQPPTTTMAPSAALMGSSVESLRRLQAKMSPQPSPKKGRRRHTSEITVPPFPQMEQHEMAHTLHHPPRQQQQPPQYIQYYTQLQGQTAGYRSMEFKSVDSHVRATDLLRSSASRYGGSLGSGLGSTEALYQGRRVLNNKLQDYMTDNRIMEQQQRLVGPDAYFQTLNNEINRLRRSSESLHRDTMYDKPVWGGPPMQSPLPAAETRTSPQTTERRKRKEKKSRKPRSWHPSPYVSEDEDDQLTREEKKAKIKAEIARRRQQIEENMRLHDELCKLAERRDRLDPGRTGSVSYVPSPTGSVAYMAQEAPLGPPRTSQDGDDTSSVLKAIDEILRKDLYSGPLSRSAWATYANPSEVRTDEYYQQGYLTMPARGRYEYTPTSELRPSSSWYEDEATQQYHHQQQQQQQQQQQMQQRASPQVGQYFQETTADPETAMDESIARIASTFPTDEPPDILLSATPGHFSPETTPAMPLLPDMPTRSRKLLENLGSSPIQPSRSGSAQSLYQERSGDEECTDDGSLGHRMQESSSLLRTQQRKSSRAPVSKTSQKYEFPVKRILLTRDPKDRSVSGNGLGMKVVGGKEVPGSNGMIGAYVAKIFPGGVVETLGEVKEGDQVLEWNGIPLTGRTYEEVQRIIASSADEVEIVIRCDLNMLENMGRQRRSSPGMGTSGGPRGDGSGTGGPPGRGPSPAHSPYSPSPRGQSPALSKRGMGGGGTTSGGGANVVGVTTHSGSIPTSLSGASSYENLQTPDQGFGHRFGRGFLNTAPTSRSVVSVLAPSTDWQDIYDSAIYSSPQSPDDFLDDSFQTHWQTGSNIEEMQFQVCCGPRTAIVYVPIVPVRPMLKNSAPALLNRNHFTRRSVDHLDDYEPLLKNGWRTNEKTLGFYDLLRPRNSFGKVSLYLNGIKEKTEHYDLKKKNGMCRVTEIKEETRERPRAPSDLPGLKPVFVNDWKGHRKTKHEENDDNNNTKSSHSQPSGEKPRKPCVGSSPEATPYNILPKGCRGSFCIIL